MFYPWVCAHLPAADHPPCRNEVEQEEDAERLASLRLTPEAKTRRVVATCCNTPTFLEFESGHWLSLYGGLWPEGTRPPIELRTMTGDLPDRAVLKDDVPNPKTHTLSFFVKLLGAWIAMGFRAPRIDIGQLDLHIRDQRD